MQLFRTLLAAAAALMAFAGACAGQGAFAAERRIALVVGESAYGAKSLPTAANDAGLIAQTLQAAGFDVTGARDLEEAALKQAFRDFLDKAAEAGPDAVAFVYFAGYGLQLEGENYLLPVDIRLARDTDIPMRALRVSDYLKPLAASGARLSVVVLDAARASPFQLAGQPLAGGLALYEPGGRSLLAFNAAPGTIAPEGTGDYGAYAHALAEMIRDGGAPLTDVFENTRLRVSDMTKGAQIPWNSQAVQTDFLFFQREANAPARVADASKLAQPIKALGPEEGFSAAIRRDTLQGYQDYVATYPAAPYAKRARAILAARREALTWRRSRIVDSPNAYWTYLRRYPKGPHAWDARRRLAELRYELEPPQRFEMIDYDYPPPPPDELVFVAQPAVYFDDPMWGFPPPPPPPVYLLPPPPPDFIVLPPPVVIAQPYVLPAPQYVPIPAWQRTPDYVAPPPDNFIFTNAHNAIVVDPDANNVVVRNPAGGVVSSGVLTAVGAGAAAVAVGAALPNFIAKRNAVAPAGVAAPPSPMGAPAGMAPAPAGTPGAAPQPAPAPGTEQNGRPALAPAPAAGLPNGQPFSTGAAKPGLPVAPGAAGSTMTAPSAGGAMPPGAGHEGPRGAGPTTQPAGAPRDHALPTPGATPPASASAPSSAAAPMGEGAPKGRGRPGLPETVAPGATQGAAGSSPAPTGEGAAPPHAQPAARDHALPRPPLGSGAPFGAGSAPQPVGAPKDHALPGTREPAPSAADKAGPLGLPGKPGSPGGAGAGAGARDHALPAPHEPLPVAGAPSGQPAGAGGPSDRAPQLRGGERPMRGGPGLAPDAAPLTSPRHPPAERSAAPQPSRPMAPQSLDSGPMAAPRRVIERAREPALEQPMARPAPQHMREAPAGMPPGMRDLLPERAQPRMREAPPQGMAPPRAYPREAIPREPLPGGPVPMQPSPMRAGPPPGMPPQMREVAPPAMHAPQPDRGPPAGMMRPQAPPPQPAPAMMRPAAPPPPHSVPNEGGFPHGGGHWGGGGGGPPGFGGMR